MDDNTWKIISAIVSIIPPLIGILISRRFTEELNRYLQSCEGYFLEYIAKNFQKVIDHYNQEIDRILTLGFGEKNIEGIKRNYLHSITDIISRELYKNIRKTYRDIKKLEWAIKRVQFFRWFFLFILVLSIIIVFNFLIWPQKGPLWLIYIYASISVILSIVFFFDRVKSNNYMDKIQDDYGIQKGN